MRSMVIVPVEPSGHVGGPLLGGMVGFGVEPLAQGGLDEALGLSVGAGPVRPGCDVAGADCDEGVLEGPAVGVGKGVVGHDALDAYAAAGEPTDGTVEEAGASLAALVGQDLGVGEARAVVDGDVQVLPAEASLAAGAIAGDAVADAVDAAELLGVDMDQLAGPGALVAHRRRLGFQRGEPAETEPAQHRPDGGNGHPERAGDPGAAPAQPAQSLDLRHSRRRQTVSAAPRRRAAVSQRRHPASAIACQPLGGGARRYPCRNGRIAHPPTFLPDPANHEVSTVDRHACMLVNVHPRLLGETVACRNHSLTPSPRMNNLHSNDI